MRAAFPQLRIEFDKDDPNRSFQRLLQHLNEFIQTINATPANYSLTLDGGSFTATQTKSFSHALGRVPKGIAALVPEGGYSSFRLAGADESSFSVQSENAVTSSTFLVF